MPKLLIEYKGIPAILNHNFEKIDKAIFIVVYKASDLSYLKKDFKSIEEAFDFEDGNVSLRLSTSML